LRYRVISGALILALAGCGGETARPGASAPPAARAPQPTPESHVRSEPELCPVLAGVLAAESEGFAPLRGRPLGTDSWLGRATLPGTERCTIEGELWPQARYLCVGPPIEAEDRGGAELAFDQLARELEQCLQQPIWFPRDWEQGERFEFALGERLQAWTDRTTFPPFQVVLKVQQDAAGPAYRVKLDLAAVP
jgi:hypothetical protein